MDSTSELLKALNDGVAANTTAINALTSQMSGERRSGLSKRVSVLPSGRYVTAFPLNGDGLVETGASFVAPANGVVSFSFSMTGNTYGHASFNVTPPGGVQGLVSYKFPKCPIGGTSCVFPVEKGSIVGIVLNGGDTINGGGVSVAVRAGANLFIYSQEEA